MYTDKHICMSHLSDIWYTHIYGYIHSQTCYCEYPCKRDFMFACLMFQVSHIGMKLPDHMVIPWFNIGRDYKLLSKAAVLLCLLTSNAWKFRFATCSSEFVTVCLFCYHHEVGRKRHLLLVRMPQEPPALTGLFRCVELWSLGLKRWSWVGSP